MSTMPFCLFRLLHTVGFKNQIESDVPANCHRWLWSWGGAAERVCQEGMLPHIWAVGLITQQVRGQQSQSWEKMRGRSRKDSCLDARPWGNLSPALCSFPKLRVVSTGPVFSLPGYSMSQVLHLRPKSPLMCQLPYGNKIVHFSCYAWW